MSILLKKTPGLWNTSRYQKLPSLNRFNIRSYCSPKKTNKTSELVRNLNDPIKFFGSPAASWTSKQSRSGIVNESEPWFQTYAVIGSVAVFLIYFCYLREENDVDLELEKSLYERVPGLEQTQLVLSYKYNRENNINNGQVVARMKELGMNPEDIQI